MTRDEVDAIAQGRVWTGAQALEVGLVDELGGLERAVALAREKADIAEDAEIRLEIYPERGTFFEMLFNKLVYGAPEVTGIGRFIPERLIAESPGLRLLTQTPRLALMPFDVTIR
jgi:protease-4